MILKNPREGRIVNIAGMSMNNQQFMRMGPEEEMKEEEKKEEDSKEENLKLLIQKKSHSMVDDRVAFYNRQELKVAVGAESQNMDPRLN